MFFLWLAIGLLLSWTICYPLTDFYGRFISPKRIRKGNTTAGKKICLTFDDGPDPTYTPHLLSILEKTRIPAAFFLVGEKIQKAPDLVKKITAAGHEVGYHTFFHRNAYLLFIKKSWATIHQGRVELEKLVGKPLVWFRPPWGALNLFEFRFLKRLGLRVVLWSANAKDWSNRTSAPEILSRLACKVNSNSIIVLHDSGGDPGAPSQMLQVLPEVIGYFQNQGFQFVSLTEILANGRESEI